MINARGYIIPAYTQSGLYENLAMITPIKGLMINEEMAPAEPEKPTMVELADLPNISLMEVI